MAGGEARVRHQTEVEVEVEVKVEAEVKVEIKVKVEVEAEVEVEPGDREQVNAEEEATNSVEGCRTKIETRRPNDGWEAKGRRL